MRRFLALAAGPAVVVAMALTAPASAETFCVQKISGCPGTFENNLTDALTNAHGNTDGRDRIELGNYIDPAPAIVVAAGNQVDIVGLGDASVLQGGGGTVLKVEDPTSTVSSLQVRLNADNSTGISSSGSVRDVAVTADNPADEDLIGVLLGGAGTLDGARIFLPTTAGSTLNGVRVEGGTGIKTISNVVVEAEIGINSTFSGPISDSNRTIVHDAFVRAQSGIIANDGSRVTVDNSLVEAASTTATALSSRAFTHSSELQARHVTLAGPGDPSTSAGASSFDGDGAGPFTSTVEVANSVISGFNRDVQLASGGNLTIDWSRFATTGPAQPSGANNTSAAPSFVNPAARDFRLAAGSALVDAGDPAPLADGESLTDLDDAPRLVNGDADCVARRDMGAFEFQPGQRAPILPTVAVVPGSVVTGQAAEFQAGSCDPDGDAVTYTWSFDDGTGATGQAVQKAFATAGTHTGTLTVRDPGGNSATATGSVSVIGPGAVIGQSILSFSMLRSSFAVGSAATPIKAAAKKPKTGSAFRFKLGIPGGVTIRIDALLPGRRSKGKCVRPTSKLKNAKRCTRAVKKGTLTRTGKAGDNSIAFSGRIGTKALPPGSYRATLAAPEAKSRTATFRIVKRG
jgi:hypothetical protein